MGLHFKHISGLHNWVAMPKLATKSCRSAIIAIAVLDQKNIMKNSTVVKSGTMGPDGLHSIHPISGFTNVLESYFMVDWGRHIFLLFE